MSKQRAELREVLRKQDVSKPLAIAPQLTFTAPSTANAPGGSTESTSFNSAERRLEIDRVQNSPGSNLTGSKLDPLKMETEKVVSNSEQLDATLSKSDPVKLGQAGSGFTQVPHAVLRIAGQFEDPIDFMVYLHLFTFSWGYQRETVDMGLTQLERFTGAARNTVRRSLDRLCEKRWIIEAQKQEPGRISRKWKVRNPAPKVGDRTGSRIHRVNNEPGPNLTPRGSNPDPVTGSKSDPYKESSKQSFKETLSLQSGVLREYFAAIKESRKRESEWADCRGLLGPYTEADIELALEYLQANGVGGAGEKCHSPMAFLAKAMQSVLEKARAWKKAAAELQARADAELKAREDSLRVRELEDLAVSAQIAEFEAAHPDDKTRKSVVDQLTQGIPIKIEAARVAIAAARWWVNSRADVDFANLDERQDT